MTQKNEIVEKTDFSMDNWTIMREQADILVKSKILPDAINTPEKAIAVMMKSRELGIGTMEGLSNLYPIKGKVTAQGQLMLSLAYRSGLLEKLEIIEPDPKTCTVNGKRLNGPSFSSTWNWERAKTAGLTGSDAWKKHLPVMLRWRAITEVLRILVPDVIAGMYTPDELGVPVKVSGDEIEIDHTQIKEEDVIDVQSDVVTPQQATEIPKMKTQRVQTSSNVIRTIVKESASYLSGLMNKDMATYSEVIKDANNLVKTTGWATCNGDGEEVSRSKYDTVSCMPLKLAKEVIEFTESTE